MFSDDVSHLGIGCLLRIDIKASAMAAASMSWPLKNEGPARGLTPLIALENVCAPRHDTSDSVRWRVCCFSATGIVAETSYCDSREQGFPEFIKGNVPICTRK